LHFLGLLWRESRFGIPSAIISGAFLRCREGQPMSECEYGRPSALAPKGLQCRQHRWNSETIHDFQHSILTAPRPLRPPSPTTFQRDHINGRLRAPETRKKKSTPSARETGGCRPDIPRRLLREGLSPYRPTTIRDFWGISNRQDGFSCNCFKVGHKDDIWPLSIYVNVQFFPVPT
jgi:hypothetical protein